MLRPRAIRVIATAGVLSLLLLLLQAGSAAAGQFTVASCQADRANYTTTAFNDFATRGMKIRRACNPEGPGMRGLVTANATRRGAVPRGSVAMVSIDAPAGTTFTTFRWAGSARRADCRYAVQLYAEGPGIETVPIKNVRANQNCPGAERAQAAAYYQSHPFDVAGATRIVQRVICQGGDGRKSCSTRTRNYIRTYKAVVEIADDQAPTATIAGDTPLVAGGWVNGSQLLNYDAQDNVGVKSASAVVAGVATGTEQRPCSLAGESVFATGTPCPNGPGRLTVDTQRLGDGTQQLVLQAQDTAGNLGASGPIAVRVDNTAPSHVGVAVDKGDGWRNQNDFSVAWTNPPESDRSPIAGVTYKLCPAGGGGCTQNEQASTDISAVAVPVPGPGEWTVSIWRRDAAGNSDPGKASDAVTLRYDPEPPQAVFDPPSSADPTAVSVAVTDNVSGLADGTVEISAAGSNTWQTLDTYKDGSRLAARIDDASLSPGSYLLRATARDQAQNVTTTSQLSDGQPMTVMLPLRIPSAMRSGVLRERIVKRTVRRNGKQRTVRRRKTELRRRAVVRFGGKVQIRGVLANRDGQGVAGAEVQVFASVADAAEQLVGVLQTATNGAFSYSAAGSASRKLRFAYAGSALVLPAQSVVRLAVPAASTLRVNRRRILNGQRVTFSGQVKSQPLPAGGKLVAIQVRLPGGWNTFRTVRTDASGRWALPYRFRRTRGSQSYLFRAALPRESGNPFAAGASRSVRVHVKGS